MRDWIDLCEVYMGTDYSPDSQKIAGERTANDFNYRFKELRCLSQLPDHMEIWGSDLNNGEAPRQRSIYLVNSWGTAVGALDIVKRSERTYEVQESFIDEKFRGKGYGYLLYRAALDQGINLYSDTSHTAASRAVWAKLARSPEYVVALKLPGDPLKAVTDIAVAYENDDAVLVARKR